METIRTYIDTMFGTMPETEQVLKAKSDILDMMEDKYNALKAEGKSENEAVGHVISEFGNIDELKAELGIETEKEEKSHNEITLSDKEVDRFVAVRKKCSVGIGFGVMLLIMAAAAFIFSMALFKNGFAGINFPKPVIAIASIAVLSLFVIAAMALLIVNGIKMKEFDKLEDKHLLISEAKQEEIKKAHKSFTKKFALIVPLGFAFIAGGIVQLVFLNKTNAFIEAASISILLCCIAFAVFLFIVAGLPHATNMQLLNLDEDEDDDDDDDDDFDTTTKAGRVGEAINSTLWSLTLIIFFVWGFVFHGWGICWIVFPIAAFLSGAVASIAKAAGSDDKKK